MIILRSSQTTGHELLYIILYNKTIFKEDIRMQKLLVLLNGLITKYKISEADVKTLQAAMSEIEGSLSDEFDYEETKDKEDKDTDVDKDSMK